jgi:hypothetical protein
MVHELDRFIPYRPIAENWLDIAQGADLLYDLRIAIKTLQQ